MKNCKSLLADSSPKLVENGVVNWGILPCIYGMPSKLDNRCWNYETIIQESELLKALNTHFIVLKLSFK